MIRRTASIIALTLTVLATAAMAADKPTVSLLLTKASATVRSHEKVTFKCDVVLDNTGTQDIKVRTNFNSVFDALELVVTTVDGKILAQQCYDHHQAPNRPPGQELTLPRGRTEKSIVFPIWEIPADLTEVKVRLVGKLPNSDYQRLLSSETLKVTLK